MVARTDSSMFGCYGDSYSYRLWSLANVWSNCQYRPLTAGAGGDVKAVDCDEEPRNSSPLGPGGPYTCPQCGGAYPTQEQLDKHETLHSPNTQSCKICQKSFLNVYRLQRHMLSHDESAVLRKFKCNDCDKAFKFKHHLKEHLRIHSGEKPFGCGNCGKRFSHSGSYSSHMTSKKCLVMNLKMGRIKPNNPALNPDRSPSRKRSSIAMVASQINNNISPNGNAFMPMSKYSEAAAAILASMSPQENHLHSQVFAPHGVQPFYIPQGMPLSPVNGIAPYSLPTISQILLASSQYQRKIESQMGLRTNAASPNPEDLIEEVTEEDDKRSTVSSAHELVMDIDEDAVTIKKEKDDSVDRKTINNSYESTDKKSLSNTNPIGFMLDSVNASATKHILEEHMQKLSPVSATICPTVESPPAQQFAVKPELDPVLSCSKCSATFNHKTELIQHEKVLCGNIFRKHEGLVAQMAETFSLNRIESEMRSVPSGASEDEDYIKEERDDKVSFQDCDRKIRVRTAISDEQQSILKEHYAVNQRPNREEFKRIAQQLGLDNRVVQVWFQNNRARIRRMNQNLAFSEQPLDLSTKRTSSSVTSSPPPSPPCSVSVIHSDSGEEAVNLSQKSSRSTTPYRNNYAYPHSNCSSSSFVDFRHSPSPGEILNSHKRLMQQKAINGLHLLPMDKYLPYDLGACESPHRNMHLPQEMNRLNPSPGYGKQLWNDESTLSKKDADSDEIRAVLDERLRLLKSFKKKKPKSEGDIKQSEGQYVCDLCDKTFIKQSSLLRHKYEHSGQRPYKCTECDRAFKHKHHLTEHKRLHTGEKPFQCRKCLKKFSHSGSYSQHMNHRYSYCKPYRE